MPRPPYRRNVVFIYAIFGGVVGAVTGTLTYLLQRKTGPYLEDRAPTSWKTVRARLVTL